MLVPSQHQSTPIPSPTTVHTHPFQSLRGPKGYLGNHSPPYGGGAGGGAATIYACFHPFYNTTLSAAFFNVAKKCTASSC